MTDVEANVRLNEEPGYNEGTGDIHDHPKYQNTLDEPVSVTLVRNSNLPLFSIHLPAKRLGHDFLQTQVRHAAKSRRRRREAT